MNSPGAAGGRGGGGGGGTTGAGGAGFSAGAETGGLTLACGVAGREGAGGGGGGANGGAGGACGTGDAGGGALFAGFPVMELKSRVNSPAFFAGGVGGGGTAGAAGGGAGGALGVAAMGCVIDPVALAAAGGATGGGVDATFPAPPPPARIGCVDPERGCVDSGRRIVTLICFAAPAPADAPPGVWDDIHTSSDSNPCRNCVTTTGCPSTSSVSTTFRRSISGSARTRARMALFSSVLPTR